MNKVKDDLLDILNQQVTPLRTRSLAMRRRQRMLEYAKSKNMPPQITKYAVNAGQSIQKIDAIFEQFKRGCHLTGAAFTDRINPRDKTHGPNEAVVRRDGSMVIYPIWELTRHGEVSDATMRQIARAIVTKERNDNIQSQPGMANQSSVHGESSNPGGRARASVPSDGSATRILFGV